MASSKCLHCGLVNFASATNCKRCEADLAQQAHPASGWADEENDNPEAAGGLPAGVRTTLILIIASVVCALTIYWVKPYLPEGNLMVIFFVPFAFVGYIVGLIVTNLLNSMFKSESPKPTAE